MSGSGLGPAGCWITHKGLETWARMAKERTTQKTQEFQVSSEKRKVQPVPKKAPHSLKPELTKSSVDSSPVLTHQSKSYPGGQSRLARTPSVTSQNSLDRNVSRQQGHRGSSPQIRTFAPDLRVTSSSALAHVHAAQSTDPGSVPGSSQSRSPSPASCHRASSLDMRCCSPAGVPYAFRGSIGDLRTPSPSQASLTSCNDRGPVSSACNPPEQSQSTRGVAGSRCLSPLLIPPVPSRPLAYDPSGPPASPLGALQPDLYQRRDGPLFLGSRTSGPSLGRLHLRIKYDFDRSDVHIHLIEAHDLAGSDRGGFNDPYVRLSLVPPVDSRKRQTAIHRNNPNPFFDQHFKFPVSHEQLQEKNLVLQPPEEMQEVLLSMSYLPSAERLTVVLLKARNLFLPQAKDNIDPFVKVYLLSGGKRVKKKKTAARKGTRNPVWNEALSFNVASSNLSNTAVEVCVMDQGNDLIGSNPLLGSCIIGPEEEGRERDHWCDMKQCPRKAVAMWHTLR